MKCDNFDGAICLNFESNNYGKDCDVDCKYKKENELINICDNLKERNIIIEYGNNLFHTRYYMLLNLDNVDSVRLDTLIVEELRKKGFDTYTDGDEVFINL